MLALLLLAAVTAIACGIGSTALGRMVTWQSRLEEFLYSTAAGLGIIAYCVLAIGLVGFLNVPALLILLLVMLAVGFPALSRLLQGSVRGLTRLRRQRTQAVERVAAFFMGTIAFLSITGALTPPTANDWDGLSYHLAVPKIYLRAGGIHYIGWMSHSNFPFTWEMLYTLGLALHGAALAKLFHWLAGALTALAAYLIARQTWGGRAGLLAACAFVAVPLAGWEAAVASNDLAASLYTLLALGAFMSWKSRGERGWLAVAACMAGFAAGCKMTALLLIAFLAAAAYLAAGQGKRIRSAAVAAALALAIASPWYVKSTIWTANPVYPFFYEIFGGKHWSAEGAREYRREQISFGMGRRPLALAAFPWNLTMHGNRFSNRPDQPFTLLTQSIGPLFLAALPLLWLRRLKWEDKFLLAYCAIFFLTWFFLSQHIRYSIPAMGVVAALAGGGASAAGEAGLGKFVAAAYAVVALAAVAILGLMVSTGAPAALGMETGTAYLHRSLDLMPMVEEINGNLPQSAKIIMYGETRGFYFDRDYMWGNHHHEMLRYSDMRGARDLIRAYRELGLTHVLMTQDFYRSIHEDQTPLARLLRDSLSQGLLREAASHPPYLLFAIGKAE